MTGRSVLFTAYGNPVTQGSMRIFRDKSGDPYMTHGSSKLTSWRGDVAAAALAARRGRIMTGPLKMTVVCSLKKPKKPTNPDFPCARGRNDVDKILRAIFDALTDVIYEDDAQVVAVDVSKRWASPGAEGVTVKIEEVSPPIPTLTGAPLA